MFYPPSTGIHRKWYCKQDQEVFPNVTNITETGYPSEISPAASNISLNATKLGFKGCFGNGPVHFKDFDDQPVLKLNTTYMPIRIYYNIRLDLTKCVKGECRRKSVTYRLLVVPGDPPQINIG